MEGEDSIANRFRNSIDENDGQERRYERAMQAECTPDFVDREKKTAIFPARGGDEYETSLEECSCPDYEKREDGFPCKHMYRLAMELGILNEEFDSGLNINKQEGKILGRYDLLSPEAKELFFRLQEIYQREQYTFFIIRRSMMTRELTLCGLVAEYADRFYPVFSKAHQATFMNALNHTGLSGFESEDEDGGQKTRELLLEWEKDRYREIHEKLVGLILTNEGQCYWGYGDIVEEWKNDSLI